MSSREWGSLAVPSRGTPDDVEKSWAGYNAFLGTRDRRKVANNTTLHRWPNGAIVVRHQQTNILTFHPDGRIELRSGGWLTYTTKERWNRFLPDRLRVRQERGRLFVDFRVRYAPSAFEDTWQERAPYGEGMVLDVSDYPHSPGVLEPGYRVDAITRENGGRVYVQGGTAL